MRLMLVTAGGLGLLRPAPGTWGSLPPTLVAAVLGYLGSGNWLLIILIAMLLAGIAASTLLAPWYANYFDQHDPSQVVCDEVAGMALCLLLLPWPPFPADSPWWSVGLAGAAFLLFRFFDILKPPPIYQSQSLRGGWGVLVDDLLAGIAAAGVCWVVILLLR
jgi:phosphatidylglycerophosphatase A